uniref:Uncharacterized protein n=1 Tax=Solanum tuberosum TaxID=4113 RepID=M1CYU2_SOLTU
MTAKKVINRKLVKVGIEIICFGKLIALHVFLFTHKCIALIEFRVLNSVDHLLPLCGAKHFHSNFR